MKTNISLQSKAIKISVIVLCSLLAIVVLVVTAFFIIKNTGRYALLQGTPSIDIVGDKMSDTTTADLYYGGKAYNYKKDLINMLFIGCDKVEAKSGTVQADTLFLAVLDQNKNKVKIISISRNTMVPIERYGVGGDYFGTEEMQLALAYVYGTDDMNSSEITAKAVSKLLYGIPTSNFITLTSEALPVLTDAIGGITVVVKNDLSDKDSTMKSGSTVKLTGKNVTTFLRGREMTVDGNEERRENQNEFIKKLIPAAKKNVKSNPLIIASLYDKMKKKIYTNVALDSTVYLATKAVNMDVDEIINIPGKTVLGTNSLAEFYVNDKELTEMVIEIFYEEIQLEKQ